MSVGWQVIADLFKTLSLAEDTETVLQVLAEPATEMIGVTGVGVSMVRDERVAYVTAAGATASGATIEALERSQETHQQGPGLAAARHGNAVSCDQIADHSDLWPAFVELAQQSGVVSAAAIPLRLDQGTVVMTLYSEEVRDWAEDVAFATVLLDIADAYLHQIDKLVDQRRTAMQLEHALDSRVIIEQAKGMLAAQRNISVDQAFRVLRRHANDKNLRLRAVAEQVVRDGLRL